MRTAFDPNDASLQVRLDNQKILKLLVIKTFGGIGHGVQKHKNIYLMLSFQTCDSWYVLIWVEEGIVGLMI
jgi:hypothetical protein